MTLGLTKKQERPQKQNKQKVPGMPVRLSPKNVFKISVKKKKEALYLFQIKTIHTYVKTYFLDYNWTKFGNKKKYCTKHYIL